MDAEIIEIVSDSETEEEDVSEDEGVEFVDVVESGQQDSLDAFAGAAADSLIQGVLLALEVAHNSGHLDQAHLIAMIAVELLRAVGIELNWAGVVPGRGLPVYM